LIGANSTIAQFDRIYNNGNKNHFTLLGSKDQEKFDKIYGVNAPSSGDQADGKAEEAQPAKETNISDDEDEDEVVEESKNADTQLDPDAEDTHDALKIVLQRQFFEAIARAACVKYASGTDGENLPTLADKLDHLFKNNFMPLAIKNKSKTQEDEKAFKLADKVFEEYAHELSCVFNYFSKKSGNMQNGRKDVTLEVDELMDMLRKANLLDGKTTDEEIVYMIEKYYSPETTLRFKLEQEKFDAYLEANPMLLRVNQEAAAKK